MIQEVNNEVSQISDVVSLKEALGKLGKHFLPSRKKVLAEAIESLNKISGDEYLRRFNLINTALNAVANENSAIQKFLSLMDEDFREFTDCESAINDVKAYQKLRCVLDEMNIFASNPSIIHRTIGGIGGGFSSGKSAFINSLISIDATIKLAEGIRPVTAIPSYVLNDSHASIRGINNKGASFEISSNIYKDISHDLLKEIPKLRDILPYVVVSAPMSPNQLDNLAFIDTPGYNPSDFGSTKNDSETAREHIKDARFLIWMVGLDSNGTIPQSDLDFLLKLGFGQNENRQLYIVANKAELKPQSDIEDILNTFEECLADHDLQYAGITAYSAKLKKSYSFRKKELFEFLDENNIKCNHYNNFLDNLHDAFAPYVEEIYRDDRDRKNYRKIAQNLLLEALKTGAINAETDSRLEKDLSVLENKFIQPEKLEERLKRVEIIFTHFIECIEAFALEIGMNKLDASRWKKELLSDKKLPTTYSIPPTSNNNRELKNHKNDESTLDSPKIAKSAKKGQTQLLNRVAIIMAFIGAGLAGFYFGHNSKINKDLIASSIITKPENPIPSLPQQSLPLPEENFSVRPDVQQTLADQEQSTTTPTPSFDTVKLQLVTNMLQAASKEDWDLADVQSDQLKISRIFPERGERKVARAANAEGLQAMQQNNIPAAIDAFTRAIAADPSDIEIRNNLGYAYIQAENFTSAVNTLTDVLIMVPDRSSAWANLSDVFARSDLMPSAEASLRLAVRYSTNRQMTAAFLQKTAESHEISTFKEIAGRILQEMDSIPQR